MADLAPNLDRASYVFDKGGGILSDATADVFGPNIGTDGRNLTISFLSLNRAKLSIRLLKSIEQHLINFAGEVLIGDNGSDPAELEELNSYVRDFPYRCRVLEFGTNLGVAKGRNRLVSEARTDWLISLDNDIFLTANPMTRLQNELGTLGCHFASFPLLNPGGETFYSRGGCLQTTIQNGTPRLALNPFGTGSRYDGENDPELNKAFLSTFLFGGAAIFNRKTFQRLGGFDEEMTVGFEDIDFSLRLFREGMKIATSACVFLVHDHPRADTTADIEYERARYSRQRLHASALHLESKTGFRVWGEEVDRWLRNSEIKQGWTHDGPTSATLPPFSETSPQLKRPRIALLCDTDDWAFANIARQLKKHLSDRFEFEIVPLLTLGDIEKSRWHETNCSGFFADGGASALGTALVACEDFDLIHVFWREFLTIVDTPLLEDYAGRIGMSYANFRQRFINEKLISTCVYDHLFLEQDEQAKRTGIFTELSDGYYVSSERLRDIYDGIDNIPKPDAVLPDGVDLALFKPNALDRFDTIKTRPLRVGWVGNSKWASTLEDFKGVDSILRPALHELRSEGLALVEDFADRHYRLTPHDDMPEYYSGIDVLICTSRIEGTPNPVLEAMACGVPVISTDVGVVPQVFGTQQKRFILDDRSVESLKDAMRRLLADPSQFRNLSEENLASIRTWGWAHRADQFASYFTHLLSKGKVESGEFRTKMCMLPFASPSMEVDGGIRLCSASSIFAYYDQTNMGNCRSEGLATVWSGDRYREVRQGLLSSNLKPYCDMCEYRFDVPGWLLQLHLSLHAYHNGVHNDEIIDLLRRRLHRYEEYVQHAPLVGVAAYPRPALQEALPGTGPIKVRVRKGATSVPESLLTGAELPIYMDFNTLNRCNVSCTMCPPAIRHDKKGVPRDPYYRLTLEEYKSITAGARISTAHFVGAYAEPLLNKDIFSLVEHAHSQGAFTAITTNAMALSAEFGKRLLDAGLDMMTISLHGATAETAERIMERSNFRRIVENICTFQALKSDLKIEKPEIYFNFVTQRSNASEMAPFVELAHRLGVRFVNLIHLIDGDEAVDRSDNLINYPDLLVPNILRARAMAKLLKVNLAVSPAYEELVSRHSIPTQAQPTDA